MNSFTAVFALCCVAVTSARPSHNHHGQQLVGVPDVSHYGKLTYPKYDLIDLGSSTKDQLPPSVVQIHVVKKVEVPKPYPVKVPYPVPHPVHIPKPYPVVETKIVQVPHPVPVEVIKKVAVPVEVPKPYPVPHNELSGGYQHGEESAGSYGGGIGDGAGHERIGGLQFEQGYEGAGDHYELSGGGGESGGEEQSSGNYGGYENLHGASFGGDQGGH